jgi:threonine dehydratase
MREISLSDIEDAARHIYDPVVRTPVVQFTDNLYLKLESLQPTGSFKLRGAQNALRSIRSDQLGSGVWTVSAGNAALGVAYAANRAAIPCSVMVVDTAPATKLDALRRLHARIVPAPYEECWRTVETHASDRMTGVFIHPFDDDRFIAGNGTAGLEILDAVPDVDAVVIAVGGGGLLAGVASALKACRPGTQVFAAEPETASPLAVSLANGRASTFEGWQRSFVDGAGGRSVLPSMWPLLSQLAAGSIVVSLAAVAAAMKLVAERCHVIAEGAAACAVAAALTGRIPGKVVAIVSGGNIDLPAFASLVGASKEK